MSDVKPNAAFSDDAATLKMLVQLMLAERQEALEERQAIKLAKAEKDKQRRINAEYNEKETQEKQALCTHKKGGTGLKGPRVDYAVGFHTFPSGESYIRCLICAAKWKNTDTAEFLLRRGKRVPNHTGIGWKEAFKMVSESTNTATSSEVMLHTKPIVNTVDFESNPHAVEI